MVQYVNKIELANLADELACFAALEPQVADYAKRDNAPHKWTRVADYAASLFERESGWPYDRPLFPPQVIQQVAPHIRDVLTSF